MAPSAPAGRSGGPGGPGNGVPAGNGGAPPRGGPPARAPEPEDENPDAASLEIVAIRVDEVLVIDEEPHFHLGRCGYLFGREVIPLPVSEALELGFGGCSWCAPVRTLAEQHADSRR